MIIFNYGKFFILTYAFVFSLVYIFCKKNPEQRFKFLFIFVVRGAIFPWCYLGFLLLVGANWVDLVIGLVVGHLYIYLKEILPKSPQRIDLLRTPYFM